MTCGSQRLSHDCNPDVKQFDPGFIHTRESGPIGTPVCCGLPAAEPGVWGIPLVLPHCPGSADVLLGGRSDFSTFSVSQFIVSTFSDLVTPHSCLLLNCSLGQLPVFARRALFLLKPEVRASSLQRHPAPLQRALRIRLLLTHSGALAHH